MRPGSRAGRMAGRPTTGAIAAEILALRAERAQLLGYADFAAFKLEPEMAKTPDAVRDLLMRVWEPARAKALGGCRRAGGDAARRWRCRRRWSPGTGAITREKRRKAEHDLDEAALKPYLSLDAMLAAHVRLREPRCSGWSSARSTGRSITRTSAGWEVTRDGRACGGVHRATISRAGRSGRARGVRRCGRSASWAARCGRSW